MSAIEDSLELWEATGWRNRCVALNAVVCLCASGEEGERRWVISLRFLFFHTTSLQRSDSPYTQICNNSPALAVCWSQIQEIWWVTVRMPHPVSWRGGTNTQWRLDYPQFLIYLLFSFKKKKKNFLTLWAPDMDIVWVSNPDFELFGSFAGWIRRMILFYFLCLAVFF